MALDDFAASGTKHVAKRPVAPEDEDLFDFPVIEMVLELDGSAAETAPVATAPAVQAKPAAPAQASPTPTMKAASPSSATNSAVDARADADAVRAAAALVAGLENALDEEFDEEEDSTERRRSGGKRSFGPRGSISPMGVLAGMLMLNLLTFGFLWYSGHSFSEGINGLKDELALASRNVVQHAPVVDPKPVVEPDATVVAQHETRTPGKTTVEMPKTAPHPLDAFEETTLTLAAQEIRAAEYVGARRRLCRLLALADRIDAGQRADIEARARFLIAESYRAQGETKESRLAQVLTPAGQAVGAAPTSNLGRAHIGRSGEDR